MLELQSITKTYGESFAIDDVSVTVAEGEIVSLLGPSGCGKSTLLRLIAGLETADSGALLLDGQAIDRTPPEKRGFGLMFQDLVLFPHLNVWDNIAFGLRMQNQTRAHIKRRVEELLDLVGLPNYGPRRVHELSGGERQRVTLARSLAPNPRLLMLDEPMGALDRRLREDLYLQVRQILKEVGVTTLYVTHDHDEAFAVSDRAVIMRDGRAVQSGPPQEIYAAPAGPFVARFLGFQNIYPATIVARGETVMLDTPLGAIEARPDRVLLPTPATEGSLLVPEAAVSLHPAETLPGLALTATITLKLFQGGRFSIRATALGQTLTFNLPVDPRSAALRPGDTVSLHVDSEAIQVLVPN